MKDRVVPEKHERFDVTFMPHNKCLIYDHEDDRVTNCTVTEAIGLSWSIRYAAGENVKKPVNWEQLTLPEDRP